MKKTFKIRTVSMVCLLAVLLSTMFCSCSEKASYNTATFTAMDTYITVKSDCSQKILQKLQTQTEKYTTVFDAQNESELYELNKSGKKSCSETLINAVNSAKDFYYKTNGSFNPCMLDLKNLWNIGKNTENPKIPKKEQINEALKTADCSKITVLDNTVILNGQKLDLGGIAKGIAADSAVQFLKSNDVSSAVLSFGGTIALLGRKNHNEEWTVAVQNPRGENDSLLGEIHEHDKFISTSGDYQQYEIIDGKRYHHIFGENGYPVDNGIISVTVVCENGAQSDALSTAFFSMGINKSLEYINSRKSENIEAIFVTSDKKVTLTSGLKNTFTLKDNTYTLTYEN